MTAAEPTLVPDGRLRRPHGEAPSVMRQDEGGLKVVSWLRAGVLTAALLIFSSARLAGLDGYPLLQQPSRNTAEALASVPITVAENFSLASPTALGGFQFRASLHDHNQDFAFPEDRLIVRLLSNSNGLPGEVVAQPVGFSVRRESTGYRGFVVSSFEYLYSVKFLTPVVLEPGSYFIEIGNDWGNTGDSFFWFGGSMDERRGLPNAAQFIPQTGWRKVDFDMSLELFSRELFLLGQRFKLEIDWGTGFGRGVGTPLSVASDNAGFFWFFDPANWEMLVKIINGCALNGKFWVFFAATTDVEFTLTVTDTVAGVTKTYVNPLGRPADAVTDTSAFATCEVE